MECSIDCSRAQVDPDPDEATFDERGGDEDCDPEEDSGPDPAPISATMKTTSSARNVSVTMSSTFSGGGGDDDDGDDGQPAKLPDGETFKPDGCYGPVLSFDFEWLSDNPKPGRNLTLCGGWELRYLERSTSGFEVAMKGRRQPSKWWIEKAVRQAIKEGVLPGWPSRIMWAAHFSRADVPNFADYGRWLKDRIDICNKTYASVHRPILYRADYQGRRYKYAVYLYDTMLLAPNGRSLNDIAKLVGLSKVEIPAPYSIERFDEFLAERPDEARSYNMADVHATAVYAEQVFKMQRDAFGWAPAPTLGSMALRYLKRDWELSGVDPKVVFGYEAHKEQRWDPKRGKYRTETIKTPVPAHRHFASLAEDAFYGGRNETMWCGTMRGVIGEHDLEKAYTSAMCSIKWPDWDAARAATDPAEFGPDVMGFALVEFRFPAETRFPCIPVKSRDEHGLIYPLQGTSHATSPEIFLALQMGAAITILPEMGVVIPWRAAPPDGCAVERPFLPTIKFFQDQAAAAKKRGDTFAAEMHKQCGNSVYGKLGQGIRPKTVYNSRENVYQRMERAWAADPYLAAHVTGLIRALIGELLHRVPAGRAVVSATTDAVVTTAPLAEMDCSGPIGRHFAGLRTLLGQSPDFLETKYQVAEYWSIKTRGGVTTQTIDGGKPKTARAGHRNPGGTDPNQWMIERLITRAAGEKYTKSEPLPLNQTHRDGADCCYHDVTLRLSLEYDFKRRPINPHMAPVHGVTAADSSSVEHLSFDTAPWETVDQFNYVRLQFERYRERPEGTLKTLDDYRRWEDYLAGAAASQAGVRRGKGGVLDQARRIFVQAYANGDWGLPGDNFVAAARALTELGHPTKAREFTDARRPKRRRTFATASGAIPVRAAGIPEFVAALRSKWPEFDWRRLVGGGGSASAYAIPVVPHFPKARGEQTIEITGNYILQRGADECEIDGGGAIPGTELYNTLRRFWWAYTHRFAACPAAPTEIAAAKLTVAGYPTTVDNLKKAKHRPPPAPNAADLILLACPEAALAHVPGGPADDHHP